jgi:cysteine-rich repeat protein
MPRSECVPTCGDGIIAGFEACDDGAANGDDYDQCTSACRRGPRCGDAHVDAEFEQCDDGRNVDHYSPFRDSFASKRLGPRPN